MDLPYPIIRICFAFSEEIPLIHLQKSHKCLIINVYAIVLIIFFCFLFFLPQTCCSGSSDSDHL